MQRIATREPKKPPVAVFLSVFVMVFVLSLSAADSIGLVPYYIDGSPSASEIAKAGTSEDLSLSQLPQLGFADSSGSADNALEEAAKAAARQTQKPIYPTHLKISSLDINLPVQNPSTTDVDALD